MGNNAIDVNPPVFQGRFADIHITRHGSDWLWAVFSIFGLATLLTLAHSFIRPVTHRVFHYLTATILLVATVNYFTQASDLGFVPVPVEFVRNHPKVAGALRQVFYTRYIDWFITTPLLLTELFLTAGLPWTHIAFNVIIAWTTVLCGLFGALVPTTYKWGYFTIGIVIWSYILYTWALPSRLHAAPIGSDVTRAHSLSGAWLLFIFFLYPIAWGVSEGGNVIAPDSEAVFYGILDLAAKIGFSVLLLFGHRDVDPARLGLRTRGYDDEFPRGGYRSEKNGLGTGLHTTVGGTARPSASVAV